jgi:hypothetical protein
MDEIPEGKSLHRGKALKTQNPKIKMQNDNGKFKMGR